MAIVKKCLFIVLLALVPLIVLLPRGGNASAEGIIFNNSRRASFTLDEYVKENFPFKKQLQQTGMALRSAGGKQEENGIFIGKESLAKNIQAPLDAISKKNTEAVASLAEYTRSLGKQAYFALIPTAAAVSVDAVPRFAEPFNQREFIDSVYNNVIGKLTALDLYLPLYNNRNQYLFYRTENNLTAYGGYQVYASMIKRMLGISEPFYNAYEISYADSDFYGDLYSDSPNKNVKADVLILLKYVLTDKEYIVTHYNSGKIRTYHTLFPEHIADLAKFDMVYDEYRKMDIYLGGLSAVTDIMISGQGGRSLSLLILGDETALAYLPFLVNHYSRVTFIDTSQNEEQFKDIRIDDYDQVLMAYSVETYASADGFPAKAELFIE